MHSQKFINEMKDLLLEEKSRLQEDLSALAVHTEVGEDEDENATEQQLDEVNQTVRSQIEDDLEKIGLALQRIEEGGYGIDENGEDISEARLRVIPWAQTLV